MGDKSKIEWTDATWNPVRAWAPDTDAEGAPIIRKGWHCEKVSDGCKNCYAESWNGWRGNGHPYKPGMLKNGVTVYLDDYVLARPKHWQKPRDIFVCSMTDLFADFVPNAWIDQAFDVMRAASHHRFQVLTKRADRMSQYFDRIYFDRIYNAVPANVTIGVSVENRDYAQRIYHLCGVRDANRFLSLEPLLGSINLTHWLATGFIHQVIVGGESGRNARPMHPDWARDIRDQCIAAGVPFFFKQWGAFNEAGEKLGKKHTGRLLDGREWNGVPADRSKDSDALEQVLNSKGENDE